MNIPRKQNPDDADIFLLQDVVSTKKTTFLGIFNQIRTKLGLGELANKNKVSQSDLEDALTEFISREIKIFIRESGSKRLMLM